MHKDVHNQHYLQTNVLTYRPVSLTYKTEMCQDIMRIGKYLVRINNIFLHVNHRKLKISIYSTTKNR